MNERGKKWVVRVSFAFVRAFFSFLFISLQQRQMNKRPISYNYNERCVQDGGGHLAL